MNALNSVSLETQFTDALGNKDYKQAERIARRGFILRPQAESACWWQRIKAAQELKGKSK
jgi:hypothetical protein